MKDAQINIGPKIQEELNASEIKAPDDSIVSPNELIRNKKSENPDVKVNLLYSFDGGFSLFLYIFFLFFTSPQ